MFEIPSFTQKEHMIQFEMMVNPINRKNVHHLLVFECEDGYVPKEYPYEHECGAVPLDVDVNKNCHVKMIVAWGIGGKYRYTFPSIAGYPFVNINTKKYLLVEMHYDNPQVLGNIVDDSGVRLYFTKQLRQHDLCLMTIGK
jgi:hypothetical protein